MKRSIIFWLCSVVAATLVSPITAQSDWLIKHQWIDVFNAERVTDLNPGPADAGDWLFFSAPDFMIHYKGALYFNADNGVSGYELFRYDGTSVSLAADIWPGSEGSNPMQFTIYGGLLYFSASNPTYGRELYRFDGKTASIAADIVKGPDSSSPLGLVSVGRRLYFSASDSAGRELWRFDGSGATMAADVALGSASGVASCCARFGSRVIFSGNSGNTGWEPWSYDGSSAHLIADLNQNGDSEFFPGGAKGMIEHDGVFYFNANDGVHGRELWRYDGSSVSLVADIVPGGYGSNPGHFAIFEDKLYFSADGPEGDELRVYDGNVVSLVADVTPWGSSSPSHLAVFDGRMYFAASDFPGPVITLNTELWAFDGATASKVEDINPTFDSNNVPRSSFPKGFTAYGDYLYFMADDGIHGYELWRLKSSPMLEINAVAISPFEKFWEWPVDMATQQQREVEVATFAVPAEGRAHLIRRSQVQLGKVARNPRLLGATLDVSAERMECFALATVVFDAISGERLGQGIDFVDVRQAQECRALQRQANAFTAALTLERIRVWQP